MTKKRLGYVQLEWVCPHCETRNPGPHKFCNGCGAPQPEDVEFEQAVEEKILTDEEQIARAQAGPDVHCPYCGARNPGEAKFCGACGGDLAGAEVRESGRVIGAHRHEPAEDVICPSCGTANPAEHKTCSNCGAQLEKEPEPSPEPAGAPAAARKGLPVFAILGGGLACALAAAAIFFLFIQTEEITGRVSRVRWERSIPVEVLAPVEREAWRDEIPADAEVGACSQDHRYTSNDPVSDSVEVCGTPYTVDTGSGFGEVVQDCIYQVYDDRCTYTVLDWTVLDTVTATGRDLNPTWPEVSLADDQREGEPAEEYMVTFSSDEDSYTYIAGDVGEFSQFEVGSTWVLTVNALGSVASVEASR
ncbi:MAG: zinc ribbon domain-containing protein [Anaerolineales bacterium]